MNTLCVSHVSCIMATFNNIICVVILVVETLNADVIACHKTMMF